MNTKTTIFSLLLFLLTGGAISQEFNDDARLWLYVKLDKKIAPRLRAQFIMQNRFDDNMRNYGQVNFNGELNYKLFKWLRITGGYVFGKVQRKDLNYNNRHQAYAGINTKTKLNKWTLAYRSLVQLQMKNIYSSDDGKVLHCYSRNKITIGYEINKRYELYMAEEINSPFREFAKLPVNRTRTSVGLTYNLTKWSYLEAYFLLQKKYSYSSLPGRDFIYGITFSHSF